MSELHIVKHYNHRPSICAWIQDGTYHRLSGPAYVTYDFGGKIEVVAFYIKGQLHREDGPAMIEYDLCGPIKKRYSIQDVEMPESDFRIYCLVMDNMKGLESTYDY